MKDIEQKAANAVIIVLSPVELSYFHLRLDGGSVGFTKEITNYLMKTQPELFKLPEGIDIEDHNVLLEQLKEE